MPAIAETGDLYEERALYVPLSSSNSKALTVDELEKELPQLTFIDAPKTWPFIGFQKFNIARDDSFPVEFILTGTGLDVLVNKNFEKFGKKPRVEFKMDIRANGQGLHVLKCLGDFIEAKVLQMYGQKVQVKSPVYNGVITMPWAMHYGKPCDIEVQSSAAIFKANPLVNGDAVEKTLEANKDHDFDVRVLVRTWILRDKEELKAGYKLHVQKIVAK